MARSARWARVRRPRLRQFFGSSLHSAAHPALHGQCKTQLLSVKGPRNGLGWRPLIAVSRGQELSSWAKSIPL
jgi:hypothetical protein